MKIPTPEDYDEIADAVIRIVTVKRLRGADDEKLVEMSSADATEQITELQDAAISLYRALTEGDVAHAREHWLDLGALCLMRAEIALHTERAS